MPTVCVNRPNRTTPRYFTARDAARVAKYASRTHGATNVAAAVIAMLELDSAVCLIDCCGEVELPDNQPELLQLTQEIKRTLPVVKSRIRHPLVRVLIFAVEKILDIIDVLPESILVLQEADCIFRRAENAFLCSQIQQWKTEFKSNGN